MDEIRLSMRLDETRHRLDPFLSQEITDSVEMDMVDTPMALTNGDHHDPMDKEADGDAVMTDDNDLGWEGATAADRDVLFGVLDDILAPGGSS
jgi:transcriptional coactivator HFI1/ADA1